MDSVLAALPFSDKEILTDTPIQFGVLGVSSVADYVVICDTNYFVVIILCEAPTTKHSVLEVREHLESILSATDTQFGVLATDRDPDNWFFAGNCRNNWFVEIPRSTFENRVARWHPDMRQSASRLNLQKKIKESKTDRNNEVYF